MEEIKPGYKGTMKTGILLALLASAMWGISGTVLQFVSQGESLPATWFLSVRTSGAGLILITISAIKYRSKIFDIFKSWKSVGWLFAYAIFGLMANLLTFYMSVQKGNASAATILQYLSPLFIVLGGIVFFRQKPEIADVVSFGIALVGVFLAITRGNIHTLAVPMNAIIWGILSGVTAAFYVVLPTPLNKKFPSMVVLGWALVIAGILFNCYRPFWVNTPAVHVSTVVSILTVIVIGTISPFLILLYSLSFAPSSVVSILDAVQPVVTFILSIIFLNLQFNWVECVGSILVIIAIFILQRFRH